LQLEIQHSLRTHLQTVIGIPAIWVYDGVSLPDETAKPYITVEQMQNNNEILAKGREAVESTYRFQVGLRANSASERARLQSAIKRTLLFDKIDLYDLTQSPAVVSGYFYAEVTAEVPIPADSTDARSNFHRVYFDVEVDVTLYGI